MSFSGKLREVTYKTVRFLTSMGTGVDINDVIPIVTGGGTFSGQNVSVERALQQDTVFACVRLISESIATLPLKLYERHRDGSTSVVYDHPLVTLLRFRPNADMTAVDFWGVVVSSLLLWGNAYIQIIRDDQGKITSIFPLSASKMRIKRDPETGQILYIYSYNRGVVTLDEKTCFHIKGMGINGLEGLSVIGLARQDLGVAMASLEVAGRQFSNNLFSNTYIKIPDVVNEKNITRVKALLQDYTAAVNAGRLPVLEGGWSVEKIGLKPEDMQLLQTRAFSVEVICRWFNVQPVMICRNEKTSSWGSGMEQMNSWFLQYCLTPWIVRIEQGIMRSLLSPGEQKIYFARYNVDALNRGDSQARATYYKTAIQNGIMTPNEVRALEDLPAIKGGDRLFMQAQYAPLETLTGAGNVES